MAHIWEVCFVLHITISEIYIYRNNLPGENVFAYSILKRHFSSRSHDIFIYVFYQYFTFY